MNTLPNGTIAVGAPGSEMRLRADLEDAAKGTHSHVFWTAYEALVDYYKENFKMSTQKARASVDLLLEANGWEALP